MGSRARGTVAMGLALCAVGIALVVGTTDLRSQEEMTPDIRATMRGVFVNLTTAYRYSLDPVAFEEPANREEIKSALKGLVANTRALEDHAGGLDPSFEYLKRSLAVDAKEALVRYYNGQYMGSRFILGQITQNCVTCHTKLPTKRTVDIGNQFIERVEISDLQPELRVNLEVATRQFDRAMSTYEEMFADSAMSSQTLGMTGAFEGYLRLCVGVKGDRPRAIATLEKYRTRTDLPMYLPPVIEDWVGTLNTLPASVPDGTELETAREWIATAQGKREYPGDRRGLVEFILSGALLHEYLGTNPTDDEAAAEAYYLLGLTEAFVSRSYWLSETSYLLAQAIHRAPKSAIARQAYEFLEQYMISGHAITARGVPDELKTDLEELRAEIEE